MTIVRGQLRARLAGRVQRASWRWLHPTTGPATPSCSRPPSWRPRGDGVDTHGRRCPSGASRQGSRVTAAVHPERRRGPARCPHGTGRGGARVGRALAVSTLSGRGGHCPVAGSTPSTGRTARGSTVDPAASGSEPRCRQWSCGGVHAGSASVHRPPVGHRVACGASTVSTICGDCLDTPHTADPAGTSPRTLRPQRRPVRTARTLRLDSVDTCAGAIRTVATAGVYCVGGSKRSAASVACGVGFGAQSSGDRASVAAGRYRALDLIRSRLWSSRDRWLSPAARLTVHVVHRRRGVS
jgi:hypothetical protein